jgi:predicted nuclease of predicted toxin-antitoxin system
MRFLANENVPGDAVVALHAAGHDVTWVRTASPGGDDVEVLATAQREKRILLTFDKDFGELAWRQRLPADCGIVLFRIPMPPPADVGKTIAAILSSRQDWTGPFAVVEPGRLFRNVPVASTPTRIPG